MGCQALAETLEGQSVNWEEVVGLSGCWLSMLTCNVPNLAQLSTENTGWGAVLAAVSLQSSPKLSCNQTTKLSFQVLMKTRKTLVSC